MNLTEKLRIGMKVYTLITDYKMTMCSMRWAALMGNCVPGSLSYF